jgi:FkbM family methyltransferase
MRRRLADTRWDEIEADHLAAMVDPARAAVDVGANVGKYAFRLARLTPTVHAFEPHLSLAKKIKRALPNNVVVYAVAASNETGRGALSFPIIAGGRSLALASLEESALDRVATPVETVTVPVSKLDDILAEPVGFIKIDVEGHELAVLEGARDVLIRDRPTILVEAEERHRANAVESVRAFLATLSYEGFFIRRRALRSISSLTPEMCDGTLLSAAGSRKEVDYVNNFIFVSAQEAASFVSRMETSLRNGPRNVL